MLGKFYIARAWAVHRAHRAWGLGPSFPRVLLRGSSPQAPRGRAAPEGIPPPTAHPTRVLGPCFKAYFDPYFEALF